jgi:hypothetical protein
MPLQQAWNEAEVAYNAGNLDRAASACASVLALAPAHPAAHWMLAQVFQAQRRFRLATHHARLSASHVQDLAPGQKLLVARGLISVGEYRAALGIVRSIAPSTALDLETLTGIVELLGMLDCTALALEWLAVADSRSLAGPTLSLLRGNHLKFNGDNAGAAAAYEDAIARQPRSPHAYLALATLSDEAGAGANAARIRKAMAALPTPSTDADIAELAVFHYALFRELDTLGDSDGAWHALAAGMHRKRQVVRHDSAAETAMYDRLAATYSAEFVTAPDSGDGDGEAGAMPIFIVGLPRSGTTLVERVLGNHSQVAACGELSDFRMRYKWASDYYCNGLLDNEAVARMPLVDARALGKAYLQATAWRAAGRRWYTDKLPGNAVFAGLILRAIPGARIVHVHREPMAGCFANLRELFAPWFYDYSYTFGEMATHQRNHARLMAHMGAVAPGRILDVRYEDFVARPEQQAARILEYCGLAPESGLTDTTGDSRPVSTASSVQVREPIHARRVEYWRRYERFLEPLREALDAST